MSKGLEDLIVLSSFTGLFFSPKNNKNSQTFQSQCYKHLINFLCNPEHIGEVLCWRGWFLTCGEDPARCGSDGSFSCERADTPVVSEMKK